MPSLSDLTGGLFGGSENASANGTATSDDEKGTAPKRARDISPFLEARSHVTNLFKKQAKDKHQYMTLCLILAAGLILSVAANVYLATSVQVKPYIVPVNTRTGEIYEAGFSERLQSVDQQVVANTIENVIEGLRNVYVDQRATTRGYLSAYDYIAKESDAASFLADFLKEDGQHPRKIVGELQRAVVEISVTPIAGTRSWNVEWAENTVQRNGRTTQAIYEGTVSVRQEHATDAEALEANPVGVYIDGATWHETNDRILKGDTSSPDDAQPPPASAPAPDAGDG